MTKLGIMMSITRKGVITKPVIEMKIAEAVQGVAVVVVAPIWCLSDTQIAARAVDVKTVQVVIILTRYTIIKIVVVVMDVGEYV